MTTGLVLLLAVAALIYFGLLHRVLDRMRLTDRAALAIIGLLIVGSFLDLSITRDVSINLGGALVPLGVAAYLLLTADDRREWLRALAATAVVTVAIYTISWMYDFGPEPPQRGFVDPLWLFGGIAGAIAYLATGRSRRSSFVAATLGIILTDIADWIRAGIIGMPATIAIGGAGVFDSVVVAGLVAVGLAEIVGEVRERLGGGPVGERNGSSRRSESTDSGSEGGDHQ